MSFSKIIINDKISIPLSEIKFITSRSAGPGGQNVNKLETRVELIFDVKNSKNISEDIRNKILSNPKIKIDKSGCIKVVSQESRSQWQNKQIAIDKFVEIIKKGLKPNKKRLTTKPTKSSKEKRLLLKRIKSANKKLRKINIES